VSPRSARHTLALGAILAALAAAGCGRSPEPHEAGEPSARIGPGPHERAVLVIEGLGSIEIELLDELAPATVAAFKQLVAEKYYDGTTFHRVVPGFMIQGGDPLTRNKDPRDDGKGGTGTALPDEYSAVAHARGIVAMANKGRFHSAEGQFFIVHRDALHLDGGFTIFGRVARGMDVVDAITELEIDTYGRFGPPDRPYPVEARILEVRIEPPAAAS
jgi:cyclophilin family peptidyl-prolyl cis-trans isomerase